LDSLSVPPLDGHWEDEIELASGCALDGIFAAQLLDLNVSLHSQIFLFLF
jgi:hypothetical protein